MLRIKQIKKYRIAKYPRGSYRKSPEYLVPALLRDSAVVAGMMLLIESCDSGTTSGIPSPPEVVTEAEARLVINRVLADNGIICQSDVPLDLSLGGGDAAHLVIDGYNDSLQVGYEYAKGDDAETFTPQVASALDSIAKAQGPYIKVIEQVYKDLGIDYEQLLESTVQQFLDTLKAHGVI